MSEVDAAAKGASGAETARRTVRLLEALARHQPVKLDALGDLVGLNKSTSYRLMRVLQEEGFAERMQGGGYRIGPALTGLAALISPQAYPYESTRPILRALADRTTETVTLHRRAGDLGLIVFGVESDAHALRQLALVGEAVPLVQGCSGRAILAGLDEPTVTAVAERAGQPADSLRAAVAQVVERGYALSHGENHPGVRGIAVPVPGGHEAPLALTISGPDARWTEDRALAARDMLTEAAADLARHLASTAT
jgi:IclR family acetate operon transcriptional repressor